jgi:hypothetical protein
MESTLREFGPATFPVYQGAEVVGVRAEQAALILSQLTTGEIDRLVNMIASNSRSDQLDAGIPDGTATEEQLIDDMIEEHSVRSPKEQLMANYAAFIIRTRSPQ